MFWEEMYINTCNRRMKLLDAFDYTGDIPCYNSENLSEVIDEVERISVVFSKDKDIRLYELNLYNGFYLVCTKDQEVMTQNRGYVAVGDLCDSDVIIGALNNNSLFKSDRKSTRLNSSHSSVSRMPSSA